MIDLSENEKKLILICKGHYEEQYQGKGWHNRLKPMCIEMFGWDADEDNNYYDYLSGMFDKLLKLYLKIEYNQSGDSTYYLSEIFNASFSKSISNDYELPIERALNKICGLIGCTIVVKDGVERFSLNLK